MFGRIFFYPLSHTSPFHTESCITGLQVHSPNRLTLLNLTSFLCFQLFQLLFFRGINQDDLPNSGDERLHEEKNEILKTTCCQAGGKEYGQRERVRL